MAKLYDTTIYGSLHIPGVARFTATSSGIELMKTIDLAGNDLVDGGSTIWDSSAGNVPQSSLGGPASSLSTFPLANADLANSDVTITAGNALTGGGSIALGGSTTLNVNESAIDHSNLAGVGASDHHARYTDTEAVAAVNAETSLSVDITGDADTLDGNHASAFATAGHHHDNDYLSDNGDSLSGNYSLSSFYTFTVNSDAEVRMEPGSASEYIYDMSSGTSKLRRNILSWYNQATSSTSHELGFRSGTGFHVRNNVDGVDFVFGSDLQTVDHSSSTVNTYATQSWVNSSADVPNADYADNAGQLGGTDASEYLSAGSNAFISGTWTFNNGLRTDEDAPIALGNGEFEMEVEGVSGRLLLNRGSTRVFDVDSNAQVRFNRHILSSSGDVIYDSSSNHVPSARVQSSGLDADTVDGQHASALGGLAHYIANSSIGININQTSWTAVPFDVTEENSDTSMFIPGPFSSDYTTINEAGVYLIQASLFFQSSGQSRAAPMARITSNGTEIGGRAATGYMRDTESHDHASLHPMAVVNVSSGNSAQISVETQADGDTSGSVILTADRNQFQIFKIG
ncbi:hypothetical protein HUG10_20440 (plasmid) [Halorarum halophilum]|uniref:Uncharacterized protein n=1 Tax=Halorarum halophilum TaxID=2743090 RepID=A0A7D5KYI7_9EURY|nr:hypothetical protein [Halobaculum halophilum]QLG29978.1 hypothetical protein HUG10_20440 [Halobaculum halophilum]